MTRTVSLLAPLVCIAVATAAEMPTELFTARWGSDGKDFIGAIASDGRQRVFVVGAAYTPDFPTTTGAAPRGNWCVYATALDARDGSHGYSAVACSEGTTMGHAADVTSSGELWVAGTTVGHGFTVTANAVQPRSGGSVDAFLLRWSTDGRVFRYATYLGGTGDEFAHAVLADANGGVWIGGWTTSDGFPAGPSASPAGAADAFIAHVDAAGALDGVYRFGGSGADWITDMAWAGPGRLALVGVTASPEDVAGGQALGASDGFVAEYDVSAGEIVWQRRLGGPAMDELNAIAAPGDGTLVVVGRSESTGCPGPGHAGDVDGWVAVLSATGDLLRESCVGGRRIDLIHDVTVDADGGVWVTGFTQSRDFPLSDPDDEALNCCRQSFVAEMDTATAGVAPAMLLGLRKFPRMSRAEGQGIAAIGGSIAVTGLIGPAAAVPGNGGRIMPSPGAFGFGRRLTSTDVYLVALRPAR